MKVAILGARLVGGPMAIDLARDREFDVTVADIDKHALNRLSANMKEKTLRYQGHIEKMSVMHHRPVQPGSDRDQRSADSSSRLHGEAAVSEVEAEAG
jgi:saccharopine dehydrogenase-like NADP-dependent oxidoreductase